jgi:CheY-like chemotaxis protein
MVVDDNADVRLLIRRILWSAGYEVTTADSGRDALALLESEHRPDLVVLDVQMPELDGWGTLEAIRSNPQTKRLPVLLCTVKGRPEDEQRGWTLGCDGYVAKPFDTTELINVVREVLARTRRTRCRLER